MKLVDAFRAVAPAPLELPARYAYYKLRGRLDPEMKLLRSMIRPGATAIDAGANVGFYTYVLADFCARVEAFEPIPACARVLRDYGAPNVRVHGSALSDREGTATLNVPSSGGTLLTGHASLRALEGEGQKLEVPLGRLDAFGFRNVSFFKIDVEGHEWEVLAGADETLRRERPLLFIEIEQRHLSGRPIGDIFAKLSGLGYQGSFYSGGALRPLAEFSYETHQRPYLNDVVSDAYINNFFFHP